MEKVAEWLERLTAVREIIGSRRTFGTRVWMLVHCSTSSKWIPGGNTWEMEMARKGTGPPNLTMPSTLDKFLSNRHPQTTESYIELTFTCLLPKYCQLEPICSTTQTIDLPHGSVSSAIRQLKDYYSIRRFYCD